MLKYLMGFIINLFNRGVSLFARIDNLSKVSHKAKVLRGTQVYNSKIDDYSYVGVRTAVIYAEVGKFCSIGANSICGMGTHTLNYLSTSPIFTEENNALGESWTDKSILYPFKKLIIGNDVWIGARAMIMGGLNIGDGAVIGAGAIVTKDVPPYAIVAGIPAKVIRYRFEDDICEELLRIKWWDSDEKSIIKNIEVFQKNGVEMKELKDLSEKLGISRC